MIKNLLRRTSILSLSGLLAGPISAQLLAPTGLSVSNQNATFDAFGGSPSLALTPSGLSKAEIYQPARQMTPQYAWKTDIVATIFWVGELPTQNNPTPNTASSWDPKWTNNFGGYDDPDPKQRHAEFRPVKFTPKENPFYFALPYNDVLNYKTTKEEASQHIPWFKASFKKAGKSVCRNRWIAIRFGERTCYAQWSDCGPFVTDDVNYVFGTARPTNAKNNGAGLDIAPAVRDYLGFRSGQKCDWRFVEEGEVPDGPWKNWGTNNPFSKEGRIIAAKNAAAAAVQVASATPAASVSAVKFSTPGRSGTIMPAEVERLAELRRQRDLWFQTGGYRQSLR